MKCGSAFVGYNSCLVNDAIEVIRCYRCSRYNHSSKNCKASLCCPRCAGDHEVKDCEATALSCINCVTLAKSGGKVLDSAHAAWDSRCRAHAEFRDKLRESLLSIQ